MFIEPMKNFEAIPSGVWKPRIEADDLEAVVHTCHKKVVPAVLGRVPFYTPDTTPNMCLLERSKWFTCVKEANLFVITERESAKEFRSDEVVESPSNSYEMFDMGVSLDRGDSRFETTRVRTGKGVQKCFHEIHRRFSNMGQLKPCRVSHPFILRSSPPANRVVSEKSWR